MEEFKQNLSDSVLELSVASSDKALILYGQDQKSENIRENSVNSDNSNSKKPSLKKIKIKILVPKGFLKNIDMNSFRIESSIKTLNSVINPSGKSSLKTIAEEARKQTFEDRQTVVPIMGKNALLAKHKNWSQDAEIVTRIVMEKFKKTLNRYKQRNLSNAKIVEENKDNQDYSSNNDLRTNKVLVSEDVDNNLANKTDSLEQQVLTNGEDSEQCHVICDQQLSESHLEKGFLVGSQSEVINEVKMASWEPIKEEEEEKETEFEYDQEKFLEEALGDEICKYSATESPQKQNDEVSTCTSAYITEEDSSINTTQISYLVSKASSVYSLFSKKLRQQRNIHTSSPVLHENSKLEDHPTDSKATVLMNEAAVQHQIIVQTCKALNICLNSKEFRSSIEYVEAEKILLLATLKRDAIKKELIKIDYEDLEEQEFKYLGRVTISNLSFPSQLETNPSNECCRWFLVIAECSTTVLASEVVMVNEDGNIRFQKSFVFENLVSDFQITVNIYSLHIRNSTKKMSHESKFHIKEETTKCPTPNKIFQKASGSQRRYYSYERRDPSFVLWGTTTIRIADLNKPAPFKLTPVSSCSTLKGIMTATLSSKVEITGMCSGFLTVGSETGGCASWSRRWCYLEGPKLYYWNYPTEQENCEPIGIIDLSYSVTSSISQVDRELCARPRTLLLETGRLSSPQDKDSLVMVLCNASYTITRHYLQADNYEEMVNWKKRLNSVVAALRNWNCMMCEIYFYKSK